jgi:hypothetical protein
MPSDAPFARKTPIRCEGSELRAHQTSWQNGGRCRYLNFASVTRQMDPRQQRLAFSQTNCAKMPFDRQGNCPLTGPAVSRTSQCYPGSLEEALGEIVTEFEFRLIR